MFLAPWKSTATIIRPDCRVYDDFAAAISERKHHRRKGNVIYFILLLLLLLLYCSETLFLYIFLLFYTTILPSKLDNKSYSGSCLELSPRDYDVEKYTRVCIIFRNVRVNICLRIYVCTKLLLRCFQNHPTYFRTCSLNMHLC